MGTTMDFSFKLTKQIRSEKSVTAVGSKRTSAGAPGCSLLVHLLHPDFVQLPLIENK